MLTKGRLQLQLIFKVFMIQLLQIHYNLLFSVPQGWPQNAFTPTCLWSTQCYLLWSTPKRQLKGVRLRQIQINLGQ